MLEKIKLLLSSIRFWQITLGAISQIIKLYFPDQEAIFNIFSIWVFTVAGIGTFDKFTKEK